MKTPASILWIVGIGAVLAWLLWRGRGAAVTVTGSDGRTYRQTYAGSDTEAQLWRTIPDDGFDYTPDLTWQLGMVDAPPIFRRFV